MIHQLISKGPLVITGYQWGTGEAGLLEPWLGGTLLYQTIDPSPHLMDREAFACGGVAWFMPCSWAGCLLAIHEVFPGCALAVQLGRDDGACWWFVGVHLPQGNQELVLQTVHDFLRGHLQEKEATTGILLCGSFQAVRTPLNRQEKTLNAADQLVQEALDHMKQCLGLTEVLLVVNNPPWVRNRTHLTRGGKKQGAVTDRCWLRALPEDLDNYSVNWTRACHILDCPSDPSPLTLRWTKKNADAEE